MKFSVISADPPWGFSDGLRKMKRKVKRSAESQYRTMTPTQVAAMPVPMVVNDSACVLALWVPGVLLQEGLDVMRAWGFKFKQVFVWVKLKKDHAKEKDLNRATRVGLGRLFRQSHEVALIGTRGKDVYRGLANRAQRSVAFDLNAGHSIKPGTLQDRLDLMFPHGDRLELFGRRRREGWVVLGDALDGRDINDSIQTLAAL